MCVKNPNVFRIDIRTDKNPGKSYHPEINRKVRECSMWSKMSNVKRSVIK